MQFPPSGMDSDPAEFPERRRYYATRRTEYKVLPSSLDVPPQFAIKENVPAFYHYTIYQLEDKVKTDRLLLPMEVSPSPLFQLNS